MEDKHVVCCSIYSYDSINSSTLKSQMTVNGLTSNERKVERRSKVIIASIPINNLKDLLLKERKHRNEKDHLMKNSCKQMSIEAQIFISCQ